MLGECTAWCPNYSRLTRIVEGDEHVVVDELLALLQHHLKDAARALPHLREVVVHGAGLVEDERQRGHARRR